MGGAFGELQRIGRRYWAVLLLGLLAGALGGWLAALYRTPTYQARATIEIQDPTENLLSLKQLSPALDSNGHITPSDIQTHVRILQSSSLTETVLRKLDAAAASGESRETEGSRPLSKPAWAAVEHARRRLQIREDRQARIVEVLFDSSDPNYAADFANTLTREYIRQSLDERWRVSQQAAEHLDKQLKASRERLQKSDDDLQAYARRAGLVYAGERQNLSEERLRQLQDALSKAQTGVAEKQSRYETADVTPVESLPDVLDDATLRDYQVKLTDLNRQRAEAAIHFTAGFPKIKQLDAQIATLEAAREKARAAILKRIRTEYQNARRQESLLAANYERQARLVSQEAEKAVQYNILKREVETNRQIYDALLQRFREASIAASVRTSGVRVVDPASVPPAPYKPNLALHLVAGLLAGFSLGAAFIVVRESGDRTLQQPGDAGAYLTLPELGAVPCIGGGSPEALRRNGHEKAPPLLGSAAGCGQVPAILGPDRVELAAWQRRLSPIATSFRAVRTSILFSGKNGYCPRVLVITSASASEGKTTVAANLAVALAGIRRRVLLIDADIRKPRLSQVFGLSPAYGLTDLLTDELATLGKGLGYVVQETSIPGLSVLTAGPESADATDLLSSSLMSEVLRQAGSAFDMVIVDTPPLLELPDARILGRMAEAVVVVIRAGRTTRESALAVKQRLQADGTKVLGTVLNDWDPRPAATYYGGRRAR
ncbi:MAG: polysaccharide biosynthesis tyrosine autokinase [Acidobacteria bacterium]|nr:polysaccharide biosynthesis tyrosine autokinase [Acidobacteriota bacterium]